MWGGGGGGGVEEDDLTDDFQRLTVSNEICSQKEDWNRSVYLLLFECLFANGVKGPN